MVRAVRRARVACWEGVNSEGVRSVGVVVGDGREWSGMGSGVAMVCDICVVSFAAFRRREASSLELGMGCGDRDGDGDGILADPYIWIALGSGIFFGIVSRDDAFEGAGWRGGDLWWWVVLVRLA